MNMNKIYLKKLLIIAVPLMLSNVISQLQMIIDRIFLGQMNTYYMSALGNVTSPMWTTMSFCFSLSMGASILISQNVGANDLEHIEEYSASLVKWSNVIPTILCFFWIFLGGFVYKTMGAADSIMPYCVGYTRYYALCFLLVGVESSFMVIMQTSNYTKPMVWYGIIRAGSNVILDWILIFGRFGFPQMGIEGAAIATTIAELLGCAFSFLIVTNNPRVNTKPSWSSVIKAPLKPFVESARLGINPALEDFAWNLGNLVLIRILNSIDDLAAGIYSIVFSIEVLIVVIVGALGNGVMTLCGEATGAKNVKQYKNVCIIAYSLCVVLTLIVLGICLAIPEQILSLFTKDQQIITTCGIYLALVCLNFFGKSGNIIIGSGIRGYGDTKWMFYTQIFGTVLVICCGCFFVYVCHFGIIGVFLAVIVDEACRALINLGRFIYITKRWQVM